MIRKLLQKLRRLAVRRDYVLAKTVPLCIKCALYGNAIAGKKPCRIGRKDDCIALNYPASKRSYFVPKEEAWS